MKPRPWRTSEDGRPTSPRANHLDDEVYRIYGVGRDFDPSDVRSAVGFYAPEHVPVIEQAFRRARELGEPYDLELQFIRADGQHIWVRTIGNPVMENGRVVRGDREHR